MLDHIKTRVYLPVGLYDLKRNAIVFGVFKKLANFEFKNMLKNLF